MLKSVFRAIRYKYLQLLRIQDSAHSVSLGLAIGIGAGALPCMGVQSLIALPIAFLLRANKIASLIGVWWTNPLTFIPIYYTEYRIGGFFSTYDLLGYEKFYEKLIDIKSMSQLKDLGLEILTPMLWGSLIFVIVLSPICYVGMYRAFEARRRRKLRRRLENGRRKREKAKSGA